MNRSRACALIAALAAAAQLVSCNDSPTEDSSIFLGELTGCAVGAWAMYTPSLDLLVATVVPVPELRVTEGNLDLWLDSDKEFTYTGNFILRKDIDPAEGSYLEGDASFQTTGGYTIEGDTIIFDFTEHQSQVVRWRAFQGGVAVEEPGGAPIINLSLPSLAPYRCTARTLEIDTLGPAGTVTMFFVR